MTDRYDGTAEVGGGPRTRDLGTATITKIAVGPMNNNAYLIRCSSTGEALLVDAAAEWHTLAAAIKATDSHVVGVLTTHRHRDHTGALAEAVDHLRVPTYAGAPDADDLPVPVDHPLQGGETLTVGELRLGTTLVRGHTPGSICVHLAAPDGTTHLFTGDTLFPGGVGATDHYDYQSFPQLIDDVEHRLFDRFDDRTWVYPGHGDDTELKTERPNLNEWRERGW